MTVFHLLKCECWQIAYLCVQRQKTMVLYLVNFDGVALGRFQQFTQSSQTSVSSSTPPYRLSYKSPSTTRLAHHHHHHHHSVQAVCFSDDMRCFIGRRFVWRQHTFVALRHLASSRHALVSMTTGLSQCNCALNISPCVLLSRDNWHS